MLLNNQEKRLLVLHLSLIEGVGPATIDTILANGNEKTNPDIHNLDIHSRQVLKSWSDVYQYTVYDFVRLGILPKTAELVKSGLAKQALLEKELAYIDAHGIEWHTIDDTEYPFLLKHISYPPAVLYAKGAQLAVHKKTIALVGSRAADAYAKKVVDIFIPELVASGWSIVSGGALGVDSMAHTATVATGGRTVVVLGSGLLRPYPRSNTKLFNQIAESGGTIVSSFGLTVDPMAGNFPARNRIIAGLSSGCVVVQAAHKSGASITAQYALDSGRTVFAVPGMIDNSLSVGCHQLLQEGACVATSAADILKELGESVPLLVAKEDKRVAEKNMNLFSGKPEELLKNTNSEKNSILKKTVDGKEKKCLTLETQGAVFEKKVSELEKYESVYSVDSAEYRLLSYCSKPYSLDELAHYINFAPQHIQQILSDMQLDGHITQNFAGLWIRI